MGEGDHVRLELDVALLDLGNRGSHRDVGISQLRLQAVVGSLEALPGLHGVIVEDGAKHLGDALNRTQVF